MRQRLYDHLLARPAGASAAELAALVFTQPGRDPEFAHQLVALLLEPDAHPAAKPFKEALVEDGIPYTSFGVEDVKADFERLSGRGVRFTQPPTEMGPVTTAVFPAC